MKTEEDNDQKLVRPEEIPDSGDVPAGFVPVPCIERCAFGKETSGGGLAVSVTLC